MSESERNCGAWGRFDPKHFSTKSEKGTESDFPKGQIVLSGRTRDKRSGLSLGDKGDPIGTEKIIDKSSIHAGLRDFDKKCYKHRSEATLQYTLTDQNALKCSVLKS